eukprot:CAMPEP_0194269110 /NCGR_PEP_ID=MMETSP0169-20130528/3326_1 /TAXON_ID=218684 /ORGANISM="Corethron pennatum, Strain L29A3" /LENGTH=309 /DNA_ID=CAMNT_0039010631 /DNA_START=149 /DNA_END=1078 /DNA_ORIENTATION=+
MRAPVPPRTLRLLSRVATASDHNRRIARLQQISRLPRPPPCETPAGSADLFPVAALGRHDDSLSRHPELRSPGGILRGLDYCGTVTFALTGCVTAAQSGLDLFGCCMVGAVTALGGGTIRDAVFLARRPFWVQETEYIWMALGTAFATFFCFPRVIEWKEEARAASLTAGAAECDVQYDAVDKILDSLDSVGLAAFAVIGAQNGIRAGTSMVISGICGVSTATFGGMTRDVLCGSPVRIVHSNAEVYAVPALVGATVYLAMKRGGRSPALRIGSALLLCVGSRYLAIRNDVKLHTWDTKRDGLGVAVRK